jgi:hypothetical protein
VPQQLDRPVDRGGSQRAGFLPPIHNPWLLQVGDEIFDVSRSDFGNRLVAKPLDERLE